METRLTYSGKTGAWSAVLRDGRRVLIDCGHSHRNRGDGRDNALSCGMGLVRAAYQPRVTGMLLVEQAVEAAGRARSLGARFTDDEARTKIQATIDAWREIVTARDFHIEPDWGQRNAGRTCGCCPAFPAPNLNR